MAIILKNSWNIPPTRWGSHADVQYAIKANAEKIYNIDSDLITLVIPSFMGLPLLDYSGNNNNGTNYGAIYKDGSLNPDGNDYVSIDDSSTMDVGHESISVLCRLRTDYTTTSVLFSKSNALANPSYSGYSLYLRTSDPYARMVVQDTDDEYAHQASGPTDIRDGKAHNVIGLWNYDTQSVQSYVDSLLQGTTSNESVGTLTNTRPLEFFRSYNGGSPQYYLDSKVFNIFAVKMVFLQEQADKFAEQPYGLYQKVSRPIYLLPIAAPTGNALWYYNMLKRRNS